MFVIASLPIFDVRLPATVALAAIAMLGYMASSARSGKKEFTVMNALIVAILVAIAGATGIPIFEKASQQAKVTALLQNLRTLRSQIELYKAEHDGAAPLVYRGTLPQLTRATNAEGIPGQPGKKYPYGPYLRSGIPVNPITGQSIVMPTEAFPPEAPSGNGGWLYHEPSGQIAADLSEYLAQ